MSSSRLAQLAASPRVIGSVVVLLALAVFANSAPNGFAMDDLSLVKRNPLIREVGDIPALWRTDYWAPIVKSGLYRPLVTTSYALSYAAWELEPLGWHVTNIALYTIACMLVWLLYRRLTDDVAVSTAAALLFTALAIHSEPVANVTFGRPELMAGVFFLAALLLHIRRFESPGSRGLWLYGGSLVAYLLALLSKESAVTLLGVIGVYDVLYRSSDREPLWRRIWTTFRDGFGRVYAGFIAATLGYIGLRGWALGWEKTLPPEISIDNPLVSLDFPWRTLNALAVMFRYVWKMFFPAELRYDYSYNQIPVFTEPRDLEWIAVVGLTALLAWLFFFTYRRSRPAFFGLCFFALTFATVSNLIVLIGTIMGERLVFLPSIGFCLALVVGLRRLLELPRWNARTAQAAFAVLAAVLVVGNGARAMVRNLDWRSGMTIHLRDAENTRSTKALNNAAALLIEQRRFQDALAMAKRAIEIYPHGYPTPYLLSGLVLTTLGRDDEAVEMYQSAIRNGDKEAMTRNNLGFILVDKDIDLRRGLLLLEEAVQKEPRHAEFRDSLGWGYFKAGRLEEARKQLEYSLKLEPAGPTAADRRAHLNEVLTALGEPPLPEPEAPVSDTTPERAQTAPDA